MDHHRAEAEAFLATYRGGVAAFPLDGAAAQGMLTKAALLPYRHGIGEVEICLMQPVGSKAELGPALHEICKGTRMWRLPDGTWVDLKKEPFPIEGQPEDLLITALREAGEEMLLPLQSILRLADAGCHPFTSASTGAGKRMQLFLAEMRPDTRMPAPDRDVSGTESVDWFSLREAPDDARIRPDHRLILRKLADSGMPAR